MGDWKNPFENNPNEKKEENKKNEFYEFEDPKNLNELFPPNELESYMGENKWDSMRYFSKIEGNYKLIIIAKENYHKQKFAVEPKIRIKYPNGTTIEQKLDSLEYSKESIYRQMLPKILKIYGLLIKENYENELNNKPKP